MASLKRKLLSCALSVPELVSVAWLSAATFRRTDRRGGANGARIRLAPANAWPVNEPRALRKALAALSAIQRSFNRAAARHNKKVSLADLIVLGGAAAVEAAAHQGGQRSVRVPFSAGRVDAAQAQTDVDGYGALEPTADAFRNYYTKQARSACELLVERAARLGLTVPEMVALVGGMRVLDANYAQSPHGVLTKVSFISFAVPLFYCTLQMWRF